MSVFRAALVKEWRGHRRPFAVLAGLVLLLAGALFLISAPETVAIRDLAVRLVMVSEAAVLVAVAPALLTSEPGNRLARRLPRGLGPVFAAKVVFLVVALALALAFALACGEAVRALLPAKLRAQEGLHFWPLVGVVSGAALALGLWVLLVSSWLRSPLLALPGTAVLLTALAAPFVWIHDRYPPLRPSAGEIAAASAFVVFAPLVAAALGHVFGARREDARARPALIGGAALLVLALPLGGWAAVRVHRWTDLRPTDQDVEIVAALLGPGGRTAWVSYARQARRPRDASLPVAFRIDLASGAARRLGGFGTCTSNVGVLEGEEWVAGHAGFHDLVVHHPGDGSLRVLDAETGEVLADLGRARSGSELADAVEKLLRATRRAVTPWRTPDGRRLYVHDGALWCEGSEEPLVAVPGRARWTVIQRPSTVLAAYGARDRGGLQLLDLAARTLRPDDAFGDLHVVAVRPGRWIARAGAPRNRAGAAGASDAERPWLLLDPADGTTAPASGLLPADRITAVLDGGPLLVRRDDRTGDDRVRLLSVDPESGAEREILVDGREDRSIHWILDASEASTPARTPAGRRVFLLGLGADGVRERAFARLDEERARLVPTVSWKETSPARRSWVLAAPDEDHVIVVAEGRAIERLRFGGGGGGRERLFPRGSE